MSRHFWASILFDELLTLNKSVSSAMGKEILSINILLCLIISWGWVVPKYQCFMWLRPLYIATQSHPVHRSHYVRESKVYLTNWRIYCYRILFLEKMFLLVSQQSVMRFPFNCLMYISSEDCQVERAGKNNFICNCLSCGQAAGLLFPIIVLTDGLWWYS